MPHSKLELWSDSPRFRAMCEAVLSEGSQVCFRVRGMSMQPNLLDGDTVVVAPAQKSELRRGDVVLSQSCDGLHVHRFISTNANGEIVTRGDAGRENDPAPQQLAGRVIAIERNGQNISLTRPGQRLFATSRILVRRLKLAAGLRFKRLGSSLALFGLLGVFGILLNAAPAAAQTDLAVTSITAAPNPVSPGGQITYTVVVINNGAGTATLPVVTMNTPANTTFVSAVRSGGTGTWNLTGVVPGGTGTITLTRTANMGAASTATFTIVVLVNTNTPGTTVIAASANISSTTADPTPANNMPARMSRSWPRTWL